MNRPCWPAQRFEAKRRPARPMDRGFLDVEKSYGKGVEPPASPPARPSGRELRCREAVREGAEVLLRASWAPDALRRFTRIGAPAAASQASGLEMDAGVRFEVRDAGRAAGRVPTPHSDRGAARSGTGGAERPGCAVTLDPPDRVLGHLCSGPLRGDSWDSQSTRGLSTWIAPFNKAPERTGEFQ